MNHTKATKAYREAAIRGASQIGLVVMMYDMIIEDLNRAVDAVRSSEIEKRTAETKHALSVLEQLQGTLNMADGGEAAINMDRLYSITRARLLEANIKNSVTIFKEQVRLFTELKVAWQQAEEKPLEFERGPELPVPVPGRTSSISVESASCDWTA
jgi:flagellar protein FliS